MESNKIIIDDPNVLKFFEDNNSLDKNEFIANLIANYKDAKSDRIVQNSELNEIENIVSVYNEKGSVDLDYNYDCNTATGIDRDNDIIMNEISNNRNDNHIKNNTDTDSDINIHVDKDDIMNTNITNPEQSIVEVETKKLFVTIESDGYEISKDEIININDVTTDFEEEKEVETMILQEGQNNGVTKRKESEREGDMDGKEIGKEGENEEKEVEREGDVEVEGGEKKNKEVEQKIVVDEVRDDFDLNMMGDNEGYSVIDHNMADNLADVTHESALNSPHIFNSILTIPTSSMNRYQHFIYNNSITNLFHNYVSTEEVSTPGFGGEVLPITISTNDGSNYDDNNVVSTDEEYNTISPLLSAYSTGLTSPNLGSRPASPLLLYSPFPSALLPSPFFPFLRQEVEMEETELEGIEEEDEKIEGKKEVEKEGEMGEEVEREEEGEMKGREEAQEGEMMLQEVERGGEVKGKEVEKEGEKGGEMGSYLFEESEPLRSHFDPLNAELDPLEKNDSLKPNSNPLEDFDPLNPGSNPTPLEGSKVLEPGSNPLEKSDSDDGSTPFNYGSDPLVGSEVLNPESDPLVDFTTIATITPTINKFQNFVNLKDTDKNSEYVDEKRSQNVTLTLHTDKSDNGDEIVTNNDNNGSQESNGYNSSDDVYNYYDDNKNDEKIASFTSTPLNPTPSEVKGVEGDTRIPTLDLTPNIRISINANVSKFQSFGSTLKFRHIQVYFRYICMYRCIYE